jgi:hypothetical protein
VISSKPGSSKVKVNRFVMNVMISRFRLMALVNIVT